MGANDKVYAVIADRILNALELGTVPWRKPWRSDPRDGGPMNFISRRGYRGINVVILSLTARSMGWPDLWSTKKGIVQVGGRIDREEMRRYSPVTFWLPRRWRERVEDPAAPGGWREEERAYWFARFYQVWNIAQTNLIDDPRYMRPPEPVHDFSPIERAESAVAGMPDPPRIEHRGSQAQYRPGSDTVVMPKPNQFESSEHYYSTLFHELTHSTGHRKRLDRPEINQFDVWGDDTYAREELVAEFGASFLCGACGIDNSDLLDNSAAYIAYWKKRIREEPGLVVTAAHGGQRAADYILDDTMDVEYEEADE